MVYTFVKRHVHVPMHVHIGTWREYCKHAGIWGFDNLTLKLLQSCSEQVLGHAFINSHVHLGTLVENCIKLLQSCSLQDVTDRHRSTTCYLALSENQVLLGGDSKNATMADVQRAQG